MDQFVGVITFFFGIFHEKLGYVFQSNIIPIEKVSLKIYKIISQVIF